SNEIVAGRWLNPEAAELSLEEDIAASLGIEVGDILRFDVAGRPADVLVSGLRSVRWDSFEVNFFALLSPEVLRGASASYITSLHIPAASAGLKRDLVQAHPNITVFDVGLIVAQLRQMSDRTLSAVQWLLAFTLLAGILVLAAALHATREERMHEAAIMRALGAEASLLRGALRKELLITGVIAGLLAAGAS